MENEAPIYRSVGVIECDPLKLGFALASDNWWMTLLTCEELGRYYLEQCRYAYRFSSLRILRPAWGSHITIVRGEEPPDRALWQRIREKVETKELVFSYCPIIRTNGKHFWLDVELDEALDLRERLGLPRSPAYPLHLTVGVTEGEPNSAKNQGSRGKVD
jgi:hypothetical protein